MRTTNSEISLWIEKMIQSSDTDEKLITSRNVKDLFTKKLEREKCDDWKYYSKHLYRIFKDKLFSIRK
jgi:hypothetical protein